MSKFDNAKVKQVPFSEVPNLGRFFTDNGVGYTKCSYRECYNDHSMRKILCDPESIVWVKE